MTEGFQILTLISIWLSILFSLVTLWGGVLFWLKHSKEIAKITPLEYYPTVSIVVPAHNEEAVIQKTSKAILNLNYPEDKVEILIFADNCTDRTAELAEAIGNRTEYQKRQFKVIRRTGEGGKSGVLNDALKMIHGDYLCVYDADAMPEENALYFLIKKVLEDPERYVASFGRNKTRNAKQNFLTSCINLEIVVTHRIQHCGVWQLFKIGRIPGTNFVIKTAFLKELGGFRSGALTEDTDLSFTILGTGKLITLAHNSEAFQQEPEKLKDYYYQRLRWAKGNYEVVINNFRHLFDHSNWRVKLETFYMSSIFFWFNAAVVLSDIFFIVNLIFAVIKIWVPTVEMPFTFTAGNLLLSQVLLFNWLLMILLYVLQISVAASTQFGQVTTRQLWLAVASYFTYSQLFIIISINAVWSAIADRLFHREATKWVKTKRFTD